MVMLYSLLVRKMHSATFSNLFGLFFGFSGRVSCLELTKNVHCSVNLSDENQVDSHDDNFIG